MAVAIMGSMGPWRWSTTPSLEEEASAQHRFPQLPPLDFRLAQDPARLVSTSTRQNEATRSKLPCPELRAAGIHSEVSGGISLLSTLA